jgi:hypothetical protein
MFRRADGNHGPSWTQLPKRGLHRLGEATAVGSGLPAPAWGNEGDLSPVGPLRCDASGLGEFVIKGGRSTCKHRQARSIPKVAPMPAAPKGALGNVSRATACPRLAHEIPRAKDTRAFGEVDPARGMNLAGGPTISARKMDEMPSGRPAVLPTCLIFAMVRAISGVEALTLGGMAFRRKNGERV